MLFSKVAAYALPLVLFNSALAGCSNIDSFKQRLAIVGPAPKSVVAQGATTVPARITGPSAEKAPTPVLAYFSDPSPSQVISSQIGYYSMIYGVPESLVRKVIRTNSGFNEFAHRGQRYGLMQVHLETARTMGYAGPPEGLFVTDTNLKYGVRYLAGAFYLAQSDEERTLSLYENGYYYLPQGQGTVEMSSLQ